MAADVHMRRIHSVWPHTLMQQRLLVPPMAAGGGPRGECRGPWWATRTHAHAPPSPPARPQVSQALDGLIATNPHMTRLDGFPDVSDGGGMS